jgi:hypothetical protein
MPPPLVWLQLLTQLPLHHLLVQLQRLLVQLVLHQVQEQLLISS